MWEKLSKKWGVTPRKAVLIFTIFGMTGTTLMFIKLPILNFISGGEPGIYLYFLYYIIIFPVFNLILLVYGFIFGEFQFFWNYEKRMFTKIGRFFSGLVRGHKISGMD